MRIFFLKYVKSVRMSYNTLRSDIMVIVDAGHGEFGLAQK